MLLLVGNWLWKNGVLCEVRQAWRGKVSIICLIEIM